MDVPTPEAAIAEARRRLRVEPTATSRAHTVPDMPFKGTKSTELMVKRLLDHAAKNEYAGIMFANGEMAAKFGAGGAEGTQTLKFLSKRYDELLPNIVHKQLKRHGTKMEPVPVGMHGKIDWAQTTPRPGEIFDAIWESAEADIVHFTRKGKDKYRLTTKGEEFGNLDIGVFPTLEKAKAAMVGFVTSESGVKNTIVPMFRIPQTFRTQVKRKGQPLMSLLPFGIGLGGLGAAGAASQGELSQQ